MGDSMDVRWFQSTFQVLVGDWRTSVNTLERKFGILPYAKIDKLSSYKVQDDPPRISLHLYIGITWCIYVDIYAKLMYLRW